jgi:hypothetical protein
MVDEKIESRSQVGSRRSKAKGEREKMIEDRGALRLRNQAKT